MQRYSREDKVKWRWQWGTRWKPCSQLVFLLSGFVFLGHCTNSVEDNAYAPYSLSFYVQQLDSSGRGLPKVIEEFLKPIDPKHHTLDNRCFAPSCGIGNDPEVPYVTISRIDGEDQNNQHRIELIGGVDEYPSYRKYVESIRNVCSDHFLPPIFKLPMQKVNRRLLNESLRSKHVFCLETRPNGTTPTHLSIPAGDFEIFTDLERVREEIRTVVLRHYLNRAGPAPYSGDYGPTIALLIDLDWEGIKRIMRSDPRIEIEEGDWVENQEVVIRDESFPDSLMYGGRWDFGDGKTSSYLGKEIIHRFRVGNWVVKLRSEDMRDSALATIEVFPGPIQLETFFPRILISDRNPNPCQEVIIVDQSLVAESDPFRIWEIDDSVVNYVRVLPHTFRNPGKHKVKLCLNEICDSTWINVRPFDSVEIPLSIILQDSNIAWSPLGFGEYYHVKITDYDHPNSVLVSKDLPTGIKSLVVPKVIRGNRLYWIWLEAKRCGLVIDSARIMVRATECKGRISLETGQ